MNFFNLLRRFPNVFYRIIRRTIYSLLDDEGTRIASEASFYLIFSIFPLLFITFLIIGFLASPFSNLNLAETIIRTFSTLVPDFTFETVSTYFQEMIDQYGESDILLSLLLFAWPASHVFYAYIDASSRAYGVPDNRGYIKLRLLSILLLFLSGTFIFIASLLIGLTPLILKWLLHYSVVPETVLEISYLRYFGGFLLLTPSIALIYWFGPDLDDTSQLKIWPGAFVATILWILFTELFGLYLTYFDQYRSLFGTLGAAMLLVLWMYLTSLAIILGAEFNYVLMTEEKNIQSKK